MTPPPDTNDDTKNPPFWQRILHWLTYITPW